MQLTLTDIALLTVAGLSAGLVNAVAGGGSLLTFPALLAVGLPPVPANVTNAVAVVPGYLASIFGGRAELRGQGRRMAALAPTAAAGSLVGAVLLLATPVRLFDLLVPFLVLIAAAALAVQPRFRGTNHVPKRVPDTNLDDNPKPPVPTRHGVAVQAVTGVGAIYGGYFGGALGVILLAALALLLGERLTRLVALKNVLSAVIGLACAALFIVFGPVSWLAVAVLAPATLVGGYLGAKVTQRVPANALRWAIVVFGVVVGVVLLVRAL